MNDGIEAELYSLKYTLIDGAVRTCTYKCLPNY